MKETERIEEITELFFLMRFPKRDIEAEKRSGYFYEWAYRFNSPDPTRWMDSESLQAYKKLIEELEK